MLSPMVPITCYNTTKQKIVGRIYTVDALVCEGEIVHWPISENVYLPSHPDAFYGIVAPALHLAPGGAEEAGVRAFADDVVSRLVEDYGFDNEFVDVEVGGRETNARRHSRSSSSSPLILYLDCASKREFATTKERKGFF